MPRGKQSPKVPERAELTVPFVEARTSVKAQLDRGAALPDASVNHNQEVRKWYEYTTELLRRICSNDELQDEFTGRGHYSFGGDINTKDYLNKLHSIYDRLDLLPAPPAPATVGKKGSQNMDKTKIFIVHGHDDEMKQHMARTLSKLGLNPIILHEQANAGKTIIEKFEVNADVSFAVVLLSPDDMAFATGGDVTNAKPRARQNVVLELGYFVGKLGRDRVFSLKRGDSLEVPGDFSGVIYTAYDPSGHWKFELVKELKAAGYSVDANSLL